MPVQQLTGKAIQQSLGQGFGRLINLGIGSEIIYSFVIIVCSLMIYYATKELYELTKHKGIKYFRLSFLFFALAYFFRSFIKIILFYFNRQEIRTILPIFGNLTLFIFIYFSTMAIFYLLYSVMHKKYKEKNIYLFHILAFIISLISILFISTAIYFILNILLLIFIGFTVYTAYHQSKKKKSLNLYVIYLLLSIFWIFNILDILVPNFFQTFQLIIYLVSSGIFLTILYKVLRKIN